MIVSFSYDFDSVDDSTISPAFLACHALFAFDSRAQCPSTALSTHVIRNTNDARFSYDHIADGGAMRTYLRDALHTQYAISDAHGGIAVRHQHDGAPPLGKIIDRPENHRLVIGVKTARRLVEQHQIGVAKEHAGQSDALFLTLRKAPSQLADPRIQAVRQAHRPVRARTPWRGLRAIRNRGWRKLRNRQSCRQ